MVALVGVAFALVLLYGWVHGKPFACFAVTVAIGGFGLLFVAVDLGLPATLLGFCIAAVAWPIGYAPRWIRSLTLNQPIAKL